MRGGLTRADAGTPAACCPLPQQVQAQTQAKAHTQAQTHTHTDAHTHTPTHAHTGADAHTRTHTHTHPPTAADAHTRTRTHTQAHLLGERHERQRVEVHVVAQLLRHRVVLVVLQAAGGGRPMGRGGEVRTGGVGAAHPYTVLSPGCATRTRSCRSPCRTARSAGRGRCRCGR